MNPIYSIIIPHKNTPELLQRCLDSIPIREDLEVIIIDDNSDKSIVNFTNFPGNGRPYTKIILNKSNKGAGHARNVGIENSKGEWILFADADDYFYTKNLNSLLDTLIPNQYDTVTFGADYIYLDGTHRLLGYSDAKPIGIDIIESDDIYMLYTDFCTPWIKMVRRKKIFNEKLRFEEIHWGNDMMFSTRLALTTKKYARVNLPIYSHERRNGSLMETTDNYAAYKCRLNSLFRINRLLLKSNQKILETEGYLNGIYYSRGYLRLLKFTVKSFFYCGRTNTLNTWNHINDELGLPSPVIAIMKEFKQGLKKIIKRSKKIAVRYPPSKKNSTAISSTDYYRTLGTKIGENVSLIEPVSPVIFSSEPYLVTIGDNTTVSFDTVFVTHDAATRVIRHLPDGDPETVVYGPITVGNNCFIGCRSIILPNVTIGDNSIIGAGSLVNRDIPANSVAAGNPCRVICTLDEYREKHRDEFLHMVSLDYEDKRRYLEKHFNIS